MTRTVVAVLGALAALLVLAELVAVPVASRLLSDAAARCVRHDSFAVTEVDRPVVPRLLIGRARGVEAEASGVQVGELRIDRVAVALPEVTLPWAPGEPQVLRGEVRAALTEDDLTAFVRSLTPVPLPVSVELDDDVARIGAAGVPLTVDLTLTVAADGTVQLSPVAGDVDLLEQLGLRLTLDPGEQVDITELQAAAGQLEGVADLSVVPGLSDGTTCDEPL